MNTLKPLFLHRFNSSAENIKSASLEAIALIVERSRAIAQLVAPEITQTETSSTLLISVIDDLNQIDEVVSRSSDGTESAMVSSVMRLVERSKAVLCMIEYEFANQLIASVALHAILSDLADISDILSFYRQSLSGRTETKAA